jgi:hypothetical protein
MSAPIVIVHGWSDTSTSFRKLGEFLRANLSSEVSVIDLADWLSLNDEVTYRDLWKAMDLAWKAQPNLASAKEVNVVTHSTGALVVRDWMTSKYSSPKVCPIKRLLMLAPANFGSPLAHMGTSFIGRVVKGARTGLQVGGNILSGLELGSDFTWELATRDVLAQDPWYGSSGILATVLVGNSGYAGVRGVVNEVGSDGTVRVSTANLNARRATLTFNADGSVKEYTVARTAAEQQTAFGVLGGLNHGSITAPDSAASDHGRWILDALRVAPAGFDAWCAELAEATAALYAEWAPKDAYFHGYQNTVVKAYDDFGNPVEEYLVEFHEKRRSFSLDNLGFLFHQSLIADVHNFKANSAFRSFYLDITAIDEACKDRGVDLFMNVDPQPRCSRLQPVGYSAVESVLLDERARNVLFRPNRTLLLEVTFPRQMVREKVFNISPLT